jgi:hypothetical protein
MNHLRAEGQKRRAVSVHEQQLPGEELPAARVVVDAERQAAGGVVDAEAVGALESHAGPLPHRVHRRRRLIRGPTTTGTAAGGAVGRVYPRGGDVGTGSRVHRRLGLSGLLDGQKQTKVASSQCVVCGCCYIRQRCGGTEQPKFCRVQSNGGSSWCRTMKGRWLPSLLPFSCFPKPWSISIDACFHQCSCECAVAWHAFHLFESI